MSRITVTIFKHGLALEADISRLTRQIQRKEKLGYKVALAKAEKELDPVQYTQVINTNSIELDMETLGHHIAKGAPFKIERT